LNFEYVGMKWEAVHWEIGGQLPSFDFENNLKK